MPPPHEFDEFVSLPEDEPALLPLLTIEVPLFCIDIPYELCPRKPPNPRRRRNDPLPPLMVLMLLIFTVSFTWLAFVVEVMPDAG